MSNKMSIKDFYVKKNRQKIYDKCWYKYNFDQLDLIIYFEPQLDNATEQEESAKFSIEYWNWKHNTTVLKEIQSKLCHHNNKKCHYEIKNILERFLISKNIEKAHSEFKEKSWLFFKNVDLKTIVDNTFDKLENPKIKYTKVDLDEIQLNRFRMYPSNFKILQKGIRDGKWSEADVKIMILRYESHLIGSQQWSIPQKQYDYLHKKYNAQYEAFASPLNSRLMGKGKFCSMFYDTDKKFGSLGDFFKVDMIQGDYTCWVLNPPFIESFMVLSFKKQFESIKKAKKQGKDLVIFGIMPAWKDSEAYKMLEKYKDLKFIETLEKNTYFYEGVKPITANFSSIAYVLSTLDDDYSNAFSKMKL